MIAETGLAGATHEIIAVFNAEQVAKYRKLVPNADERLFLKSGDDQQDEGGIQFDAASETEEVDVDDI
jgi:coproporphyrinogen III oxidase